MIKYAKCLILLMFVGAGACFAATPFTPRLSDPVHESWRWRSFPELKGQGVSCLAQDGDGNFLFGTDRGIYRYDGMNWDFFPFDEGMVGARINALYVAGDGGVYVGSDRGIGRFENGIWERVFPSEGEWNTWDLMASQDGSLWAGTEWGALRLTPEGTRLYVAAEDTTGIREMVSDAVTFVVVPLDNRRLAVYDVCEGPDGAIWFGMYDGDLIRFDFASGYRRFGGEDEIDQGTYPRICVTEDGVVWVVYGDKSKRVNRFDGEKWEALEVGDLGRDHHYTSILESGDGTLWIGGSRLIAHRDGVWRVYDSSVFSHRMELHEATDGALWIVDRGEGAVRLDLGEDQTQTYEGLIFQCDTPDGAQWFISQDNGVVRYDGQGWTRFGVADGLMDAPSKLFVTRDGALWASGSHEQVAATARLDSSVWILKCHPRLSWGIDPCAVYEAFDGSLWFVAAVDWWLYGFLGGVVVFDGKGWTHHAVPGMTHYVRGIGQSSDGVLWFGGRLFGFDGVRRVRFTGPEVLAEDFVDAVYTAPRGDLWLGSRTYGVFRYDGTEWQRFDYGDGLADNRVQSIFQDRDGAVWAGTAEGVSRFDGRTWLQNALPPDFPRTGFYDPILQSRDGIFWLNSVSDVDAWHKRSSPGGIAVPCTLRTVRYVPETDPPETLMTLAPDEVPEGGEITFAWSGTDLWRSTLREDLQYAYRLDGGEWSPYSGDTVRSFEDLDVGTHTIEVKARDLAFNEEPVPSLVQFNVVPVVWRRPWFIGLISGFVILTGYLVLRIIVRDRRLRQANEDLASANETQLLQSARLVSLGQMVAGVAHELNQPLTVVETTAGDISLRLMEGMPLETDELQEMMEDVRGVVGRMAGTVDHLRVFSRDESEEPRQAMDVNAVIASSLKLMGSQLDNRGVDLVLDLSDALPEVWGHPHPLEQVVLNLLSNARDAVDERAEMEGVGYDKQTWIRTQAEDDAVVIEVEDNGVGMDEAIRQRLFEPFFTTKDADRGTGLGLSIVYAIVRNHDGEITVESEEGVGTTFKVMLPVMA
ncbi:MAG: ATP-binding protein [Gemmatimonadetes bacterium]|nr:ATP-binding protein [Gemmatimonadota bacterium]